MRAVWRVEHREGRKGYTHALTHWRKVLNDLNALRIKRGMCVILLAHAKVEKFEDPEHSSYDRYSPRLHKHATALITEWADAVLFATRKIITKTEEGGFGATAPSRRAWAKTAASACSAPLVARPAWRRTVTTCPLNFPSRGPH